MSRTTTDDEVIRQLLDRIGEEHRGAARDFHDAAEEALRRAGYQVEREVHVPVPGRWRSRVDLVLNGCFAVELDRRSPRRSSRRKIRAFGAGMIYCREPYEDLRTGREGIVHGSQQ